MNQATEQKQPTHKPIEGPAFRSALWQSYHDEVDHNRERPVVFGASRAASCLGLSPYETPYEIACQLLGTMQREPFTPDQIEKMAKGLLDEPYILKTYGEKQGRQAAGGVPMMLHPSHSFMAATPDGVSGELQEDFTPWDQMIDPLGIECKSSGSNMLGKSDNQYGSPDTASAVPLTVYCQCQQQAEVMGWQRVDVALLVDNVVRVYEVPRDDELIAMIIEAERHLAECVLNGRPPEIDHSHPRAKQLLQEKHGYLKPAAERVTTENDSDEIKHAWNDYVEAKAKEKAAKAEKDRAANVITQAANGASVLTIPSIGREFSFSRIAETYYSQTDIDKMAAIKSGDQKRAATCRMTERKTKQTK